MWNVRNNESDDSAMEFLKVHFQVKTASKAILKMLHSYMYLYDLADQRACENNALREELKALKTLYKRKMEIDALLEFKTRE